jgi:hypothetical protein
MQYSPTPDEAENIRRGKPIEIRERVRLPKWRGFRSTGAYQTTAENWIATPVDWGPGNHRLHITVADRSVFNTACGRPSKAMQDKILRFSLSPGDEIQAAMNCMYIGRCNSGRCRVNHEYVSLKVDRVGPAKLRGVWTWIVVASPKETP